MDVVKLDIPDVLLLTPRVFPDDRGFFLESWNARTWREATGLDTTFVQDNHSRSARGVVRGLHYQVRHAQGKLVRVVAGEIFDVAVDLRRSSPTFGRWVGAALSAENHRQLWIPAGFAHAFMALSESADVLYKASDYYDREAERSIRWDDPELGIAWPSDEASALSDKDERGVSFREAETYP